MAVSYQINESAPQSGLGTFSSPAVATTGNYVLEFKSFLPFLGPGDAAQSTVISQQIVDVTCAADSAGSKNSTWWSFNSASDAYKFYVWYNINSAGVDPAPAGYNAGIQVAGATGASAATLATATITAINASTSANPYVVATAGASGHLILTNTQYGQCTAAANGTASYGATFSVTQTGTFGTPAVSGLVAKVYNNSVLQQTFAFPSPTQQLIGGSVHFSVTAGNKVDLILSSLSTADAGLNSVKTIINFYQGV